MRSKKNMKKAIFLISSFSGFAQSIQGLVIDNGVRLRRYPCLDAEIVGKKDKNSIINIYSYSGSGKFVDGILGHI